MHTPLSFLEKATRFLSGFLIGVLVIVLFLKLFSNLLGPLLGAALNIGFYYYSKKRAPTQPKIMLIAQGALASAVFSIVLGIILWTSISALFSGAAA